jgi:hypothetical protein
VVCGVKTSSTFDAVSNIINIAPLT